MNRQKQNIRLEELAAPLCAAGAAAAEVRGGQVALVHEALHSTKEETPRGYTVPIALVSILIG